MANNLTVAIATAALARIKAQGLRTTKADKAALEFVTGALAATMHQHGESSPEASGLAMLAMLASVRGVSALSDVVSKDAAQQPENADAPQEKPEDASTTQEKSASTTQPGTSTTKGGNRAAA